ncbi:MAG: hypothetical protein WED33_13165 [Bacteroidia bacterium]
MSSIFNQTFSQTLRVGEAYSLEKSMQVQSIAGETKDEIILVRATTDKDLGLIDKVTIERFNKKNLNYIGRSVTDELFDNKQTNFPEALEVWNDSVCVFSSEYLKQEKDYALKMRYLRADGSVSTPRVLLESSSLDFTFNRKHFRVSVSPDGGFLSAMHFRELDKKGETEISLVRYDSLFKPASELQAVLPFPGKELEVVQEITDNAGNLHLLLKGKMDEEEIYSIFAFPVFGNELIEYKLDIPGKRITSVRMVLNEFDKLLVSGLFRENFEELGKNSGVFNLRIDRESGSIEGKGISRFDTDLNGLSAGEQTGKQRNSFDEYVSTSVFPMGKNGSLFIAEIAKEEEICETDYRNGLLTCSDSYSKGNLLMISFNEKGLVDWYRIIENQQRTFDDEGVYIGIVSVKAKQQALLNLRNEGSNPSVRDKSKAFTDFRNSEVGYDLVNSNGQIELSRNVDEVKFPLLPYSVYNSESGKVYLISEFGGKAAMVEVQP